MADQEKTSSNSFSSDELNLLILRYLEENNFPHAAYSFLHESRIYKSSLKSTELPQNSLIGLVQRGVAWTEIESSASNVTPSSSKVTAQNSSNNRSRPRGRPKKKPKLAPTTSEPHQPTEPLPFILREKELVGHTEEVFAVQWNPKFSNLAVTAAGDSCVILWNVETGKNLQSIFHEHLNTEKLQPDFKNVAIKADVTTISWSVDGQKLVTADAVGFFSIWKLVAFGRSYKLERKNIIKSHEGSIFSTKFSPDDRQIITTSADKTIGFWDVEKLMTHIKNRPAPPQDQSIESVLDRMVRLASEADPITAKLFLIKKLTLHTGPVLDLSMTTKFLAAGSADESISLLKLDGSKSMKLKGHEGEVNSLRFSPDECVLASASEDATVRLWQVGISEDVFDKEVECTVLKGHTQEVFMLDWSPDQLLASASFDNTIKVWKGAECVFTFKEHTRPVYTVSFCQVMPWLCSGGTDKTMCVFDIKTGKVLEKIRVNGNIFEVNFAKNSKTVIAAGGAPKNAAKVLTFR